MQIRELEQETGLDRATIRFYEREGLITPLRQENGYRTYSEEDVRTLMKVKLLRKLGMSLDTIRSLQQGSEDFPAALEAQRKALEEEIGHASRAQDICREIRSSGTEFRTLDAPYYLKKLDSPGIQIREEDAKPETFRENVPRGYHPVRRYLARMVDYGILAVLLRLILIVLLRIRPYGTFLSYLVTYGSWFFLVPIQALFLSQWGTTPGKWLMGLGVEDGAGGHMTFSQAREREWAVLRYGLGWGIPGLRLWRLIRSYREYVNFPTVEMEWDEGNEYLYKEWNTWNKAALAVVACLLALCMGITATDLCKPRYRGENLTVAEFAENYNYYLTLYNETADSYDKLMEDGGKYPVPEGVAIVYMEGDSDNQRGEFQYETDNGFLRKITYKNHWTNVSLISAPVDNQCFLASCAMLMAQPGAGAQDLKEFAEKWDEKVMETSGSLTYGNLEFVWSYTAENCITTYDGWILPEDEDTNATLTVQFDILIH